MRYNGLGLIACAACIAGAQPSQWNFDGNLNAAFGSGILDYFDGPGGDTDNGTSFGTASSFGLPSTPDGGDPMVMSFPKMTNNLMGYVCLHGTSPNGGGAYINEYTLIWDVYIPGSSYSAEGYLGFYNTNEANNNDGDIFLRTSDGGIGISGVYNGVFSADTWHRVAITFTVDTVDDTVDLRKYIDGTLVGIQNEIMGLDGRWSLYSIDDVASPWFVLFGEDTGDSMSGYLASVYYEDRALSGAEIGALGCVSSLGATSAGPDCSTQDPACDNPADLNNDGALDIFDVIEYLSLFDQGCG
ncbi:MAG: hypothetical protein KDB69_02435 [Acidimicrobiia bacterium]|nr:hypothetical protein [Acidimicrobiia bacterium]